MQMQRLTPVLFVDAIEPCLSFWTERLGFEIHAKVEDGGRYVFVLLLRDEVEVMYQTRASLDDDLPRLAAEMTGAPAFLYIRTDDLDTVEEAVAGVPLVQERRTTFYGADEIALREPAGNVVVFAQFGG